jgi:hypothetical protein
VIQDFRAAEEIPGAVERAVIISVF